MTELQILQTSIRPPTATLSLFEHLMTIQWVNQFDLPLAGAGAGCWGQDIPIVKSEILYLWSLLPEHLWSVWLSCPVLH